MANKTKSKTTTKKNPSTPRSSRSEEEVEEETEIEASAPDFDADDEEDAGPDEATETPAGASGGKTRKPRGPRTIVYVCGRSVLNEDETMTVQTQQIKSPIASNGISGPTGNAFDRKAAEAEVTEIYRKKHREDPEFVAGPFYLVRDPQNVTGRKRETLNMNVGAKYGFSGESGTGIHKGWSVIVNFTRNPDLVLAMYNKIVNPVDAGVKKNDEGKEIKPQKPPARYIPTSSVQNLVKDAPAAT